jgi:hypothetical protein
MFYPVEDGSVYEIPDNAFGFTYVCHLPPVGYGINSQTGELEETDIIKRSDIPEEQYWERPKLPHDYKEKRKQEKERQDFDKFYYDPYLEKIRQREWKRRLCGVWFWNYNPKRKQSELIYITGVHYLYITYWRFQGKFMDFRINDMEFWYLVKYIETDPNCLGLNEITKRKLGKTAKLGCWLYERTSRMSNHHSGFQSKSDPDAEEVMLKAIVLPWQKLPDFFRPIYDTMKGDEPSELRFFHTSRRGSSADKERDEEDALESWIDYGASGESVYDGPELGSYGCDEAGKTKKPVNIKERQNVVRYCAEIDGEFLHRKQIYTTTVEIEDGEEDNYDFLELTAMSNPLERDDNGRTLSGLYTYFLPAQKGMYFDKYGFPDEERALKYITNTSKKLEEEGKIRELSSFKRKNPTTFKEAFSADGSYTLYNPGLLNRQLDNISWTNKFTERGNLKWKDGHRVKRPKENMPEEYEPSEIIWEADPNGKYEKVAGWFPAKPNNVFRRGAFYYPNNNYSIRIGCDPFKYDKTKDKRRSNCAAFAYQIPDKIFKTNYDDMFVLRYAFREESTRAANEDVLKMAWWCGCEVLFERNVNHWKNDFIDWECAGFFAWLPGEVEPGIITTGNAATSAVQTICNYTEAYINRHIDKVYFKTLIRKETGWLGFKVEDTEKFDEPMAAGITLVAVRGATRRNQSEAFNITDYFPKRKIV